MRSSKTPKPPQAPQPNPTRFTSRNLAFAILFTNGSPMDRSQCKDAIKIGDCVHGIMSNMIFHGTCRRVLTGRIRRGQNRDSLAIIAKNDPSLFREFCRENLGVSESEFVFQPELNLGLK
jgi:hypothetical protein